MTSRKRSLSSLNWSYKKRNKNNEPDSDDSSEESSPIKSLPSSKLLNNIFGKSFGHDDNDEKEAFNHIYFYEDVDLDSCLHLSRKIRATAKKIQEMQLKCDLGDDVTPKIYLHISSFGGDIMAAFSVIDTMLQCKIPIVTILEGGCASCAILISVAGKERWMGEYAYMLIHQLSSGMWGQMDKLENEMENLKELMRRIKNHLIRFSNGKCSGKELDDILKKDMWWTATDALEYGLIDRIITGDKKEIGNSLNVAKRKKAKK
jgi:ATP-dependent Clp endopeptidase proteolytic subunit ClpP